MKEKEIAATLKLLAPHLKGLEYGSVEIVIHEGRPVQFDRRERHRVTFKTDPISGGEAPLHPEGQRTPAAEGTGENP